ncbi:hypothetical protein [Flammeovirga pacifica]|uniref:Uncharacterized protein n=1 Tax=Flammeovirga pacifica TaxID=915059 RepID=A0A1S1Z4P1_FLAPC|nr:hypothetical protein [Flammeovirga pacifica]OHX68045.1 hypothetical protein NH26_17695 [Flammeovirga pacifica]
MITYHKITLEGELKYSDITSPIFMVVTNKNNQLQYGLDPNGEILSPEEYDAILSMGMNQFAETRIYETFLQFREEGRVAMIQDYLDVLEGELKADVVYDKLIGLEIFEEDHMLRNAS